MPCVTNMRDIKTHKFEEIMEYLADNGLEFQPGTLRWEPGPKRAGRLRLAINVQKIEQLNTETDNV